MSGVVLVEIKKPIQIAMGLQYFRVSREELEVEIVLYSVLIFFRAYLKI